MKISGAMIVYAPGTFLYFFFFPVFLCVSLEEASMKNFFSRILSFFFLLVFTVFPAVSSVSASGVVQEAPGRDIVFVVDVSGSMVETDPDYRLREELIQCAESFAADGNRVGAVPFSDQLGEILPLTALTPEGLEAAGSYLRNLSYTNGDTDIGLGISQAVDMLTQSGSALGERDQKVILITDGIIDLPHAASEKQAEKDSLTSALNAAEAAKGQGIIIDTIGLGEAETTDANLLGYLAERTGGTFAVAVPGFLLSGILTNLAGPGNEDETEELAETEEPVAETEVREETEPETEAGGLDDISAETELPEEIAPPVIGSITGQVELKGLLPAVCRTQVDLHDLFDYTEGEGVFFRAEADDPSIAACSVKGSTVEITGRSNGMTQIRVIAEKGNETSEIGFLTEISAVLTYGQLMAGAAVLAGAAAVIVWLIFFRRGSGTGMYGSLRYYVKQEGQKIFGVPSQDMADLTGMKRSVKLSEIVRDPYLETADIGKGTLRSTAEGIVLESRSGECVVRDESGRPVKKLLLTKNCRFRVTCATDAGTAELIAVFTSGMHRQPEEEPEEKTRLLV